MTHFEYISVAISIVLSLAVLRLLDALPDVFQSDKRYWVHGLWVGYLIWWTAVYWYLSWAGSSWEGEFDFPTFLLLITPAGLFHLAATALVSRSPGDVASWREHFWAVRRRIFALVLALWTTLVFISFVLQRVPFVDRLRVGQVVLLGLFTIGFFSRNERTHGVVAALGATFALAMVIGALVGLIDIDLRRE